MASACAIGCPWPALARTFVMHAAFCVDLRSRCTLACSVIAVFHVLPCCVSCFYCPTVMLFLHKHV